MKCRTDLFFGISELSDFGVSDTGFGNEIVFRASPLKEAVTTGRSVLLLEVTNLKQITDKLKETEDHTHNISSFFSFRVHVLK